MVTCPMAQQSAGSPSEVSAGMEWNLEGLILEILGRKGFLRVCASRLHLFH